MWLRSFFVLKSIQWRLSVTLKRFISQRSINLLGHTNVSLQGWSRFCWLCRVARMWLVKLTERCCEINHWNVIGCWFWIDFNKKLEIFWEQKNNGISALVFSDNMCHIKLWPGTYFCLSKMKQVTSFRPSTLCKTAFI